MEHQLEKRSNGKWVCINCRATAVDPSILDQLPCGRKDTNTWEEKEKEKPAPVRVPSTDWGTPGDPEPAFPQPGTFWWESEEAGIWTWAATEEGEGWKHTISHIMRPGQMSFGGAALDGRLLPKEASSSTVVRGITKTISEEVAVSVPSAFEYVKESMMKELNHALDDDNMIRVSHVVFFREEPEAPSWDICIHAKTYAVPCPSPALA